MTDWIGQRLDDYEIIRLIGESHAAQVYGAHQSIPVERDVAIKIIRSQAPLTSEFLSQFGAQVEIMTNLNHAHILTVYGYGEHEQSLYWVMALMSRGSLADRIQRGPMSFHAVANIVDQVCSALDYVHPKGIVHGNLKPQNILFDKPDTACLSDFGMLQLTDEVIDSTRLSELGCATAYRYQSPEQCRSASIDRRSDLYSFGIILYEMLTGQLPFQAETAVGMASMHLQSAPPPAHLLRSDLLPAVEQVFETALAKDPAERYPTAGKLAAAYRAAIFGASSGFYSIPRENQSAKTLVNHPAPAPCKDEATKILVKKLDLPEDDLMKTVQLKSIVPITKPDETSEAPSPNSDKPTRFSLPKWRISRR